MAFSLSFSSEFFFAEGEPYDRGDIAVNRLGQPLSVWSAISLLSEDDWDLIAREVFEVEPQFLTHEMVLDKILETDTCRDLSSPVEVYIDNEGWHSLLVFQE